MIPPTGLFNNASLRNIEQACRDQSLMQRAGAAAAEWAGELAADRQGAVLVLAGPGNNGGDAFEVARCLRERGFDVQLIFAADPQDLPADASAARAAYLAAGGSEHREIPRGIAWRLIIDGIFGIGLSRAPTSPYAEWITAANTLRQQTACPVLALDCPSGLDADRGSVHSPCVAASHTITFIAGKPGLYTGDGPDYCGELRIDRLQLDTTTLGRADGELLTRSLFAKHLHPRRRNTHKGVYGSAGIAGGATSMAGAALLAGRAALKLGAGRVYVGLIDAQAAHLDPLQPELMIRRPAGLLDAGLTALACGPGLGGSLEAVGVLETALAIPVPLVLDADALSLLAQEDNLKTALGQRRPPTILTPHPGEAASLLDCEIAEIQRDRIAAARAIACQYGSLVNLKGCGSIVATPDGEWWVNTTGNPGMASAGMGDVLTGMIVSLLAQGWTAQEALLGAVHLHGQAADDLVAQGIGPAGLTAGEVIDAARRRLNLWMGHG